MADENDTATPPVDTTPPVETTTPPTLPVETPVAQEQPTPAPAPIPSHDPWLLKQASELGIPAEEAVGMSAGELQRACYLLGKQRVAIHQQFGQPKAPETPAAPEPDFALPTELKAKLAEFDPVLVQAIEHTGRAAVERAKKAEAEVASVRQQTARNSFAQQVNAAMTGIPAVQQPFVLSQLAALSQQGVISDDTPPSVAVPMAHKMVLAAFGGAPAVPPPPPAPKPAPTTSPKPTNRLPQSEAGKSLRDELLELYSNKLEQYEDEDAATTARNGNVLP